MIAIEHIDVGKMRTVEKPDPEPGPGEVRVALRAGGICGSDLHVYRREPWQYTHVLGHEPSGVIDNVGPGISPARLGERVTVYHYDSCGGCQWCRMGEKHWCADIRAPGWHVDGSCGSKLVAQSSNALPLPDDMSFEAGAILACGAATTWGALTKVNPNARDDAVVWGLGPVGLCGVMILKAFGCRVVAVGRRSMRLQLAGELGADAVIDDAGVDDPAKAVREHLPQGASLAYETTGNATAQRAMIDTMGRFGRAAVVGIGSDEPAINLGALTNSQLTLYGSHVLNHGAFDAMVQFVQRHQLPLDRIVTHRYPYEQGDEAFRVADSGNCAKVVLVEVNE